MLKTLELHWNKHHLNDMNAACLHQEKLWDLDEKVTLATFTLNTETINEQYRLKKIIEERIEKTGSVELTDEEQAIYALPYSVTIPSENSVDPRYKFKNEETKNVRWVYPKEHDKGILTKPCPICGYKYGSAWLKRAVPQDVLDWLFALPDTTTQPAWV